MVTRDDLGLAETEEDPEAPDWQREAIKDAREVIDSDDWVELPKPPRLPARRSLGR